MQGGMQVGFRVELRCSECYDSDELGTDRTMCASGYGFTEDGGILYADYKCEKCGKTVEVSLVPLGPPNPEGR